jgi:hypothetical protein
MNKFPSVSFNRYIYPTEMVARVPNPRIGSMWLWADVALLALSNSKRRRDSCDFLCYVEKIVIARITGKIKKTG